MIPRPIANWLRSIVRKPPASVPTSPPIVAPVIAGTTPNSHLANDEHQAPPALESILHVAEVDNASFFVSDLFRRKFAGATPDTPRHFVAFYRSEAQALIPIGYVHHSPWENCYMCGGLVIDDRIYRRLPAHHRRAIRERGGIAEYLLTESFKRVKPGSIAIWGHVGNKQAEEVDLRVGFEHTDDPYVMVIWNQDLPDHEKAAWVRRVVALGGF